MNRIVNTWLVLFRCLVELLAAILVASVFFLMCECLEACVTQFASKEQLSYAVDAVDYLRWFLMVLNGIVSAPFLTGILKQAMVGGGRYFFQHTAKFPSFESYAGDCVVTWFFALGFLSSCLAGTVAFTLLCAFTHWTRQLVHKLGYASLSVIPAKIFAGAEYVLFAVGIASCCVIVSGASVTLLRSILKKYQLFRPSCIGPRQTKQSAFAELKTASEATWLGVRDFISDLSATFMLICAIAGLISLVNRFMDDPDYRLILTSLTLLFFVLLGGMFILGSGFKSCREVIDANKVIKSIRVSLSWIGWRIRRRH